MTRSFLQSVYSWRSCRSFYACIWVILCRHNLSSCSKYAATCRKSYISSLFIAWMLGHFPEESVMRNCCSDTLYNKLSYDARDIVKSKRFHEIFPDIYLKGDKQNVKSWNCWGSPSRFLILAVVLVELLSVSVHPCSPWRTTCTRAWKMPYPIIIMKSMVMETRYAWFSYRG